MIASDTGILLLSFFKVSILKIPKYLLDEVV